MIIRIFLGDSNIDYALSVYDGSTIHYTMVPKNAKNKTLYSKLEKGMVILNGQVLDQQDITKEELEYLKSILANFNDIVKSYKEIYKRNYLQSQKGTNREEASINAKMIEVPDQEKMKQWVYMNFYDYLENFVSQYEEKIDFSKVKTRILRFLKNKEVK